MKIIRQSHEILSYSSIDEIEVAARTCYQSESNGDEGRDRLIRSLIRKGHHAMLEFGSITIRFVTNRSVTHELVRHRMASFAQESTRYVRYGDIEIIEPVWFNDSTKEQQAYFISACQFAGRGYRNLIELGWNAQEAREVLPNALKAEIVVNANFREWRHIFGLRCAKNAHPQIRALMTDALNECKQLVPIIFDDIEY